MPPGPIRTTALPGVSSKPTGGATRAVDQSALSRRPAVAGSNIANAPPHTRTAASWSSRFRNLSVPNNIWRIISCGST